ALTRAGWWTDNLGFKIRTDADYGQDEYVELSLDGARKIDKNPTDHIENENPHDWAAGQRPPGRRTRCPSHCGLDPHASNATPSREPSTTLASPTRSGTSPIQPTPASSRASTRRDTGRHLSPSRQPARSPA